MEPSSRFLRHEPSDRVLLGLGRLPSTDVLLERQSKLEQWLGAQSLLDAKDWRAALTIRTRKLELEELPKLLERAFLRDAIQRSRPEGCWCLGTGGKMPRGILYPHEEGVYTVADKYHDEVYLETCKYCEEGRLETEKRDTLLPEVAEQIHEMERRGAWSRSGISLWAQNFRLSTWPLIDTVPDMIADLYPEPHKSVLLWGPVGTGKTGLAIGYAWEALRILNIRGLRFVTVPKMLSEMRDTYNHPSHEDTLTEAQVIARYTKPDLVILDDLGAEQVKGTGWVEDRLYQVIGQRHDERRATVFTSNYSLDALGERLGERIMWRIREMVGEHIINMTGLPNIREME